MSDLMLRRGQVGMKTNEIPASSEVTNLLAKNGKDLFIFRPGEIEDFSYQHFLGRYKETECGRCGEMIHPLQGHWCRPNGDG